MSSHDPNTDDTKTFLLKKINAKLLLLKKRVFAELRKVLIPSHNLNITTFFRNF